MLILGQGFLHLSSVTFYEQESEDADFHVGLDAVRAASGASASILIRVRSSALKHRSIQGAPCSPLAASSRVTGVCRLVRYSPFAIEFGCLPNGPPIQPDEPSLSMLR